ncbi:MAG: DUF6958 family protein [Chloroflexota bacterium]
MSLETPPARPIERRRADAFLRIGQNALGTSLAAAVPTPALELTKMIGIAAADAWMFYDIYRIYYDERLSASKLKDMLGTAGVIVFTGGVFSYGALKISQSLLGEFLNIVPVFGWMISGVMTGASSVTLGLAWMAFVEAQYREERGLLVDTAAKKKHVAVNGKTAAAPRSNGVHQAEAEVLREKITRTAADAAEKAASAARRAVDAAASAAKDLVDQTKDTTEEIVEDAAQVAAEVSAVASASLDELLAQMDLMPDEEGKVTALHPDGKQPTRIDADKYITIRQAIIEGLRGHAAVALQDLTANIEDAISDDFEGSVRWYVTTVKLDLEARGMVERVPDVSPQHLRLVR